MKTIRSRQRGLNAGTIFIRNTVERALFFFAKYVDVKMMVGCGAPYSGCYVWNGLNRTGKGAVGPQRRRQWTGTSTSIERLMS